MTEPMGERGRQGAAPLGGTTTDERWEHIRLGLGFILLTPGTMTEHQIAVEAYEGLKADHAELLEALENLVATPLLRAIADAPGVIRAKTAIAKARGEQ